MNKKERAIEDARKAGWHTMGFLSDLPRVTVGNYAADETSNRSRALFNRLAAQMTPPAPPYILHQMRSCSWTALPSYQCSGH